MTRARPILLNLDEIVWDERNPARPLTILAGDPNAPGPYTIRSKVLPGGPGERPHWHPHDEYGTVISGTIYVAAGERTDRGSAKALRPGAFVHIPPNAPHALWSEGDSVMHAYGIGPRVTYMVAERPPPRE